MPTLQVIIFGLIFIGFIYTVFHYRNQKKKKVEHKRTRHLTRQQLEVIERRRK